MGILVLKTCDCGVMRVAVLDGKKAEIGEVAARKCECGRWEVGISDSEDWLRVRSIIDENAGLCDKFLNGRFAGL